RALSSIFIVFTIAFASDTNSNEEATSANNSSSDKQSVSSDVAPIDIKLIQETRIKKAIKDKKYAESTYNKHLREKSAGKADIQKKDVLSSWAKDIQSKLTVINLKRENGKKAIELPSSPKSN
ncbi:MAG: hypothetical protein P8J35_03025, partial [Candidatus Marinimicrobia bacterium]|nr:hypothetical protein [Candidatus Neomarinimicrobiota bacterium]